MTYWQSWSMLMVLVHPSITIEFTRASKIRSMFQASRSHNGIVLRMTTPKATMTLTSACFICMMVTSAPHPIFFDYFSNWSSFQIFCSVTYYLNRSIYHKIFTGNISWSKRLCNMDLPKMAMTWRTKGAKRSPLLNWISLKSPDKPGNCPLILDDLWHLFRV